MKTCIVLLVWWVSSNMALKIPKAETNNLVELEITTDMLKSAKKMMEKMAENPNLGWKERMFNKMASRSFGEIKDIPEYKAVKEKGACASKLQDGVRKVTREGSAICFARCERDRKSYFKIAGDAIKKTLSSFNSAFNGQEKIVVAVGEKEEKPIFRCVSVKKHFACECLETNTIKVSPALRDQIMRFNARDAAAAAAGLTNTRDDDEIFNPFFGLDFGLWHMLVSVFLWHYNHIVGALFFLFA